MMVIRISFLLILISFYSNSFNSQNSNNYKVLLQGFWWDYYNSNYNNRYSDYLVDLAPRLRSVGIDAVWIPPSIKNTQILDMGYAPFDHYDLGDKNQKGSLKTKL